MSENLNNITDIRLLIPMFLLDKLKVHPLTNGLYPISLGKQPHFKNDAFSKSISKDYWLFYCHHTNGKLFYKNKTRKVKHGDLVIIEPNHHFTFFSEKSNKTHNNSMQSNAAIYWLNFSGNLAENFAQRLLMKMDDGLAQVGTLPNVVTDFDNLLELGRRGYTATNVIHAVHVLQQALSYLALQLRLVIFNRSSKFNLAAIEELMRNNIHQELNLSTLAEHAQLSKFHFSKKFKELTDSSPIQHFINMKIQYACNKLDNSDLAVKVIASELGYNDPYYFSRLFKKMIGLSPKQYRDSRHQ